MINVRYLVSVWPSFNVVNIYMTNNSVALVRERLPLVGEVNTNFLRLEVCRVVSVPKTYGRNLGFLDRSRQFFFQVAPQLYS
jgi:hypothetical protein